MKKLTLATAAILSLVAFSASAAPTYEPGGGASAAPPVQPSAPAESSAAAPDSNSTQEAQPTSGSAMQAQKCPFTRTPAGIWQDKTGATIAKEVAEKNGCKVSDAKPASGSPAAPLGSEGNAAPGSANPQ